MKMKARPDPDARLPFPTRLVKIGKDMVEEYLIPDERKEEVLHLLYPFIPVPSLDDELLDGHEDQLFTVRDFKVYREGNSNVLASPYYPVGGGTVIDWEEADDDEYAGEEEEGFDERMRGKPTTPEAIDSDYFDWPESWEHLAKDAADSTLCAEMFALLQPFAVHLAASGMDEGKLTHYLENLETLGATLCAGGGTGTEYLQPTAAERLTAALRPDGGPQLSYHPGGEAAEESFHATCRKLYAFLLAGGNNGADTP